MFFLRALYYGKSPRSFQVRPYTTYFMDARSSTGCVQARLERDRMEDIHVLEARYPYDTMDINSKLFFLFIVKDLWQNKFPACNIFELLHYLLLDP